MDRVRLTLFLVTIAIALGPIATVLFTYRNNPLDTVLPPQIREIANNLQTRTPTVTSISAAPYNSSSGTILITIDVNNTYPFTITINSVSADAKCVSHSFALGRVASTSIQSIPANSTGPVTLVATFSKEAITHINDLHSGASSIDLIMTNITADIEGLEISLAEMSITVPIS